MGRPRQNPHLPDYVLQDCGYLTPCWIWQHAKSKQGYGMITIRQKQFLMHRVMYEQKHGSTPFGLELDHLCHQTLCINPDHLEAVTHAVNVERGRRSKLNPELVREARRRYLDGESQVSIARNLGVHSSVISEVVRGKIWRGVI